MSKKTQVLRRKPLTSTEDIQNQIHVVVDEIQSFSTRISTLQASSDSSYLGFDLYSSLSARESLLFTQIRPGKPLSAPSLLLMYGVLQAVQSGPHTERAIKDSIMTLFKAYGLKISNRAVFAGTNLDVPSVCAMFHAMGVLTPVVAGTTEAVDGSEDKTHDQELLSYFKTKFDQAYQEYLSSSSTAVTMSSQHRTHHNQYTKKSTLLPAVASLTLPPPAATTTVPDASMAVPDLSMSRSEVAEVAVVEEAKESVVKDEVEQQVGEEEEEDKMMGEVVDMLLMDHVINVPTSHTHNDISEDNVADDSRMLVDEENGVVDENANNHGDNEEDQDREENMEMNIEENIEDDDSDQQDEDDNGQEDDNNNNTNEEEGDTAELSEEIFGNTAETTAADMQYQSDPLHATSTDPAGAMLVAPAPPSSSSKPSKKSQNQIQSAAQLAASRIWKLSPNPSSSTNSVLHAFLTLINDNNSSGSDSSNKCVDQWRELGYTRSVHLEVEEKMIRRLLTLANNNTSSHTTTADDSNEDLLVMEEAKVAAEEDSKGVSSKGLQPLGSVQPYRLGTRYLLTSNTNSDASGLNGYDSYAPYNANTSHGHSQSAHSSSLPASDGNVIGGANGNGQQRRDVLDTSITITASFLLDKVTRSQRQRGRNLPLHANPSQLLGPAGRQGTQVNTQIYPNTQNLGKSGLPSSSSSSAVPQVCAFSSYHVQLHRIVSKKTSLSFFLLDQENTSAQQQQSFYPPNKRFKSSSNMLTASNSTAVHELPTFAEFLRYSTGYSSLYSTHPSAMTAESTPQDDSSNNGNSYTNYQYYLTQVNYHKIALNNHQVIFNNSPMIVSMVRRYPPPAQLVPPYPPQYSNYYHQARRDSSASAVSAATDNINQSIANGELWTGPVAMADLLISTNEQPWRSIVPEFATLDAFDDNVNPHDQSYEESAHGNSNSNKQKKRNRADSQANANDAYQPSQHVDKKRRLSVGNMNSMQQPQQMVIDVMAPSFVLLPSTPSALASASLAPPTVNHAPILLTTLAQTQVQTSMNQQDVQYHDYHVPQQPSEAQAAHHSTISRQPSPGPSPSNVNGGGRSPRNTNSIYRRPFHIPSMPLPLPSISEEDHNQHDTTAITMAEEVDKQLTDEEDLSDEACLARHERVLQAMREKWAKMSRLRQSLASAGAAYDGKGKTGGGVTPSKGPQQQRPRKNSEGSASSATSKHHPPSRLYQPAPMTTELGQATASSLGVSNSSEDMLMMETFSMPRGGYGGHSQRQAPSTYYYQQQDYQQGHSSADEAGSHGSSGMPKKRGRPPKQQPQHQQHVPPQQVKYTPVATTTSDEMVVEEYGQEQLAKQE